MMYSILSLLAGALLLGGDPAGQASERRAETTRVSKVVRISGQELVLLGADGEEHTLQIDQDTAVTCDGKRCRAEQLRAGMRVRETSRSSTEERVTRLEARIKNPAFARSHEGIWSGLQGDQLTMVDDAGGAEHAHTLDATALVTCDDQVCQASELQPGQRIRVTTRPGDQKVALAVEAIEKQSDFATAHDGEVVSISGDTLVMNGSKQGRHTHRLLATLVITCDGAICQPADLKPGVKIRLSVRTLRLEVATRLEALDMDADFAAR